MAGAKEAVEKVDVGAEKRTSGAKARHIVNRFTARLKSCPDTKPISASQNRISRFKSWTPRMCRNHTQYCTYNRPQTNEPDTSDHVPLSPKSHTVTAELVSQASFTAVFLRRVSRELGLST
jgi:hypothetical protein